MKPWRRASILAIAMLAASCSGRCGSASENMSAGGSALSSTVDDAATLELGDPSKRKDIVRFLESLYNDVEAASKTLPRDAFDPAAVVSLTGPDSNKLLQWVRDHTYWVAYQGTLRGSKGVLMDRLGNSLDRSLLLAELVRLTGRRVRLARANLTDAVADQLLASVKPIPLDGSRAQAAFSTPPRTPVPNDLRWIADRIRQSAESARVRNKRDFDATVERVGAQADALIAAISSAPDSPGSDRRAAMRRHWWVQFEDAGAWVDLDPMTKGVAGDRTSQPEATVEAGKDGRFKFEAADRHEVSIRVIIERWQDKRLSEHVVLQRTVVPSEILGESVAVFHEGFPWKADWSPGRSQDPGAAFREAVIGQRNWIPILHVGAARIKSSLAFTTAGDVGPSNAMSALGRSAAGGILDAFGGGDSPGPGFLTAEWIEYEIVTPGRPSRTLRHEVFDILGPAARASGATEQPAVSDLEAFKRGGALLGETEILPLVCDIPSAWLYELTSTQLLASRSQWTALALADSTAQEIAAVGAIRDRTSMLRAITGYAVARRHVSPVQGLVYQDSIGLVNLRWRAGLRDNAVTYGELIDFVANDVAVLQGVPQPPFRVAVRQGVADTAAERLMFSTESSLENTTAIFALATKFDVKPIAIRNRSDAQWREFGVMGDTRTRVEQDLALGNLVVLPSKPLDDRLGWWRVNPVTGATIGVMDRGFRQGDAEYSDTNVVARSHIVRKDQVNWMKGPRDVLKDLRVPEDHPHYMEMIGDVIELQEKIMKARKIGIAFGG